MSDPIFVFDTNVLVSAHLFNKSVPASAFFHGLRVGRVIRSSATLRELIEVLERPKLARMTNPADRDRFVSLCLAKFQQVTPTETITDCRDPKDNKFLELAVAGGASAIITGDQDLLALHPFREIQILAPADFLAQYPG